MKKRCDEIESFLERNFESQVEFLSRLVKTKSSNPFTPETSSPDDPIELQVAKIIEEKAIELNLSPKKMGISSNRPNIICELGKGKKKGGTLILNGHMDTVMPSKNYSFNPYSGKVENNKLYGVGSSDMKASLSIFLYTAKALQELNQNINGKLILTFVVDEEPGGCSEYGTKHLLKNGLKGDAAIVAEPGSDKISIGHRGGYRFKLTTHGKATHTGLIDWEKKKSGKNAILEMSKAINALQKIEIPFIESPTFPGRIPVLTFPTMIDGGSSINVVPERCSAYGEVRLLPGNDPAKIKDIIKNCLDGEKIEYDLVDVVTVPAVEISNEEAIVKVLAENSEKVLKRKPKIVGCGPWNDAWMFIEKGIPAISGFGPDGENVHSSDEFVYIKSLRETTEIFIRTVIDFVR